MLSFHEKNLKARLFELIEERDGLQREVASLKREVGLEKEAYESLSEIATSRARHILELSQEIRELKGKKDETDILKQVANDVSDVFRNAGIDIF